jgi:hypothetical protein
MSHGFVTTEDRVHRESRFTAHRGVKVDAHLSTTCKIGYFSPVKEFTGRHKYYSYAF